MASRTKKWLSTIALMGILGTSLAGCGGDNTPTTGAVATATTGTAATATTGAPQQPRRRPVPHLLRLQRVRQRQQRPRLRPAQALPAA